MRGLTYEEQISKVTEAVKGFQAAYPEIQAVGVSIAGDVDTAEGTVSYRAVDQRNDAANFEYSTIPIRTQLEEATGLPVVVENDGNAATLAEWKKGAAQDSQNVVSLSIGTFLGSGVVLRGSLVERRESGIKVGAFLVPGQGFHDIMPVGHYASGVGLRNLVEHFLKEKPNSQLKDLIHGASIDGKALLALARQGNEDAMTVYSELGKWIGLAATSAINMFQPEVVVLGGGVMAAHEFIMPSVHEMVLGHSEPGLTKKVRVELAQHAHDSCLIGAAILAFGE